LAQNVTRHKTVGKYGNQSISQSEHSAMCTQRTRQYTAPKIYQKYSEEIASTKKINLKDFEL